jgi:uncharacterized protein YebE (UPF0316 family)
MYIILFFVGILEMYISAMWTKKVSQGKAIISGGITFVNILIWYFVLRTVLEHLGSLGLILVYALGCSIGTIIGTRRAK